MQLGIWEKKSSLRTLRITSRLEMSNKFFKEKETYSDNTVAIAAPSMPRPRTNIKMGSRIPFSKVPIPDK